MSYTDFDPETERFGSARFADGYDIRKAGLLNSSGLPIGYYEQQALHLDGDAPMITFGGAGSGKLRDIISYVVCNGPTGPMIYNDPRGEITAISQHTLAPRGIKGYFFDPYGINEFGQHSCNVLDMLKPDCPKLQANAKFIMQQLVVLSGSETGRYFELTAQRWFQSICVSRVERNGFTSLPDLYRTVKLIEGDPNAWADELSAMMASKHDEVGPCAEEILYKQQEAPREFSGIMGEIHLSLSFLSDPLVRRSLEDGFSLSELICDRNQYGSVRVGLLIPQEYLQNLAPVMRLFFGVAQLLKTQAPRAKPLMMLIDEAATLKRFEALLTAYSYGRGAGVRTWSFWQDIAQVIKHHGQPGLQSLMGSSQLRQFFGVRDYQTAKMISDMIGNETLRYDDEPRQRQANRHKYNAARSVLLGGDPFEHAFDHAHYDWEGQHRSSQQRAKLTPDEILALPEHMQLLFISGKYLAPILGDKYPYFTRREMAGKYLSNPYHPPTDSVEVRGLVGQKRLPVIHGPVPAKYKLFPQYQNGKALWVKGYPLT